MLARQNNIPYQDFLIQIFSDEVSRRDSIAGQRRSVRAKLDASMRLENWDDTAARLTDSYGLSCVPLGLWIKQTRFCWDPWVQARPLWPQPLDIGKRGKSTLIRADRLFKELKAARLQRTCEREMRRFISLSLPVIDDFGIDRMDATESKDFYEIVVERHNKRSTIITSNREPAQWLSIMDIRAQSAVDRLQNAAYELIIEGESYRKRQKPSLLHDTKE